MYFFNKNIKCFLCIQLTILKFDIFHEYVAYISGISAGGDTGYADLTNLTYATYSYYVHALMEKSVNIITL